MEWVLEEVWVEVRWEEVREEDIEWVLEEVWVEVLWEEVRGGLVSLEALQ